MRILVADDEKDIADAIGIILKFNKLESDIVYDGISACNKAEENFYDCIILDIMMPGMDGIEVLKKIRAEHNNTPVLMLTAKSQVSDKVNGLNTGADDYLTKPFNKDELIARINVLLRRNNTYNSNLLVCGNITLDTEALKISNGDTSLRLAGKEIELLEFLINHKDKYIKSDTLIEKIWNDEKGDEHTVILYIGYLRNKLKSVNASVEIASDEKTGYCLREKE